MTDASIVEEEGQYAVTFDIEAYKIYTDTLGNESPVEYHECVDVGVFADADEKDLITYEGIFIEDEKRHIHCIVTERCANAGHFYFKQHVLNFLPLPHGQGSFLRIGPSVFFDVFLSAKSVLNTVFSVW